MRSWIRALIVALLANPGLVSAQEPAAEPSSAPPATEAPAAPAAAPGTAPPAAGAILPDAGKSGLVLLGRRGGQELGDFRFRMGEGLEIGATGAAAAAIKTELAKAVTARVLTLYLDGVPMNDLPVSATTAGDGSDLRLRIELHRDPNDDKNRAAWDAILGKQKGYTVRPDVAFAVGSEPALAVQSAHPFLLYVAPIAAILWTLVAGLLILGVVYYFLVRNDAALRDAKGGSYSLGKSQMAFWGLLVALAFVGVWLLTDTMERIPAQVLILLGISGATGLGSVMIGATPKPSSASKPADFWRDLCSDTNGLSWHRMQVVIWTVILGAVFIRAVAQAISMPEFSETLLVLMGISGGTYLGFKIPKP